MLADWEASWKLADKETGCVNAIDRATSLYLMSLSLQRPMRHETTWSASTTSSTEQALSAGSIMWPDRTVTTQEKQDRTQMHTGQTEWQGSKIYLNVGLLAGTGKQTYRYRKLRNGEPACCDTPSGWSSLLWRILRLSLEDAIAGHSLRLFAV